MRFGAPDGNFVLNQLIEDHLYSVTTKVCVHPYMPLLGNIISNGTKSRLVFDIEVALLMTFQSYSKCICQYCNKLLLFHCTRTFPYCTFGHMYFRSCASDDVITEQKYFVSNFQKL